MDKDKLQMDVCQAVKAHIASCESGGLPSDIVEQFCVAYGLDIGNARMQIFTIDTVHCKTACYVVEPEDAKACVVLVHGYLDHAMSWRKIVPRLLKEGYMVLMYDLKGHGFSDGTRADIGDFSEYREQLGRVLEFAGRYGRLHAVAHSTGAGVLADMLLHDKAHAEMLTSSVLIAPLLHSAHWRVTRMAVGLLPLKSVNRSFRKNSSDSGFKDFQKADPLQYDKIPVSWTNANAAWAKRMVASTAVYDSANVLFIQGEKDNVVDWKYNMKKFKDKFPKGEFKKYKMARHQLMNESPEIIDELCDKMVKWLEKEQECR